LSIAVTVGHGAIGQPGLGDFRMAFVFTAMLGLIAVGLATTLDRNAGSSMRSDRSR
jgi:hypothetical protein